LVDSSPLQGPLRGLSGLLRPAGAPGVSERAAPTYDLLVVGGGINGTGIARDASGRGLTVLLCEQDDLAAHTSSASTKLIHGDLRRHIAGEPLKESYRRGFVYSDVQTDDARLVVLNALDARSRGATILTRTRCERLTAQDGIWSATLAAGDDQRLVRARAVVNATGPWVSRFVAACTPIRAAHQTRLVKGSPIVVPRLFTHRSAYIFQ